MREYGKTDEWGPQITKEEADYREGTEDEKCSLCTMFRPPSSCTYVKGSIRGKGLCDFFERK